MDHPQRQRPGMGPSQYLILGGVAPPELAQARAEEARERECIWYVACTRA